MSPENSIASNELSVKILEESDDLTVFDCSQDDALEVNEFIHSEAIQYQKEKLGVTHLFLYENRVIGFATLAMSEIEIKEAPSLLSFKTEIRNYPALLIGQLAVHNNYRGRHVGRSICLFCLETAKRLSKEIGCKLVVVFTEEGHDGFYEKCGFQVISKYQNKKKKWMYIQVP